jgi:putative transposase
VHIPGVTHNIVRNLGVKRRKRRKRAANIRTTPEPAKRVNERWSMDFVTDRLGTGRAFRVLTLIDQYTRECPVLETRRKPHRPRCRGKLGAGWR